MSFTKPYQAPADESWVWKYICQHQSCLPPSPLKSLIQSTKRQHCKTLGFPTPIFPFKHRCYLFFFPQFKSLRNIISSRAFHQNSLLWAFKSSENHSRDFEWVLRATNNVCPEDIPVSGGFKGSLLWWTGNISSLTFSEVAAKSWVASNKEQCSVLVPSMERIWSPTCNAPHLQRKQQERQLYTRPNSMSFWLEAETDKIQLFCFKWFIPISHFWLSTWRLGSSVDKNINLAGQVRLLVSWERSFKFLLVHSHNHYGWLGVHPAVWWVLPGSSSEIWLPGWQADLCIRKRLQTEISTIGACHSTAPGHSDLRFLKQSSAFTCTKLHLFLVRSVHWSGIFSMLSDKNMWAWPFKGEAGKYGI